MEIKELNVIRAVAYLSLIAGCVLAPLIELHWKFCSTHHAVMEDIVAKIEYKSGGFNGSEFYLFH